MTDASTRPAPQSLSDGDGQGRLTIEDTTLELPRVLATEGSDGLGIARLLRDTGLVTIDPGFTNTASCTSDIR